MYREKFGEIFLCAHRLGENNRLALSSLSFDLVQDPVY